MQGPGIPPQHGHQPSTGGAVGLRVLFALLPVLSCGLLAWGTMLRLALVTRKSRDWWLLGASVAAEFLWVLLSGLDPTPDNSGWQANLGAACTIATGVAVTAYFLVADIRHQSVGRAAPPAPWYPAPPAPYVPPQQAPAYGYPYAPRQSPTPVAQPAPESAPAQAPAPPRIGQVRAELDELSELLRKQPPQPPHHGGPYGDGPHGDGPRR
ncbi:hypothetical protein J7F03_39130 [Streptomyces sp. ISL-43]|uniref:hypothetical protein n=1 Tax=Streptomyces sp. ISL-43 TaxID=2819183 RepID=UPI001BEA74AA|nr:hypothetical protein [Streptomyces sp. ISL-43]MBT2452942.1 hypothetical protein [Streptomyces sp. ISL-43]